MNTDSNRRILITGMGILSPIGIGVDAFQDSLMSGKSGIKKSELYAYLASPDTCVGEVSDFNSSTIKKQYLKNQRRSLKVMCREIQLGVASANLAVEDSALDLEAVDSERFGIEFGANLMLSPPEVLFGACVASSEGSEFQYKRWGADGLPKMEPLWLLKYLPNMPACHIGIIIDARGPSNSITQAEASGNLVLGEAQRVIERGWADVMIAGVTGTRVHEIKSIHAKFWDQLADSPAELSQRSRPFDNSRTGQVVGEAACSLLLEEKSHAENRGAKIWGELLGSGASCVINRDGTANMRAAISNSIKSALKNAGVEPGDIGHINAHGLGEQVFDVVEFQAIQDIFGDKATEVPVTALKSYFGNSGSGCGIVEASGSLVALKQGVIPATLNYETPDADCPLNVVRNEPLATDNKLFLKISSTTFGQASASVICGA
ncbi:MAG: beta-ketoacyl-[acyl-carrier-protein] synthase family protein [Planctomycetes bacterium]|nr:beta-ketoacyl-[acyl-carrier-protein] synthase family protein [Planctomycetota bacterium]MCH9727998.1 beta-ketoacyl-[acyl-carrier-protein] synthase family protein [Planctomycetota bacterium]MCH9775800.1 beta-ketoacyl-[acyl-carrier-protein] synthase family protein [Planctomycetota bacterium]MCH9789693.1 beta-ketoacyl-[acyl-carrier-protein] synthase family protein [Planctomycetota bacterium]MDF1743100.1 beta-ketoacyl-[acyl-carrier-protein] synthase family protein [Gimesia sp.]